MKKAMLLLLFVSSIGITGSFAQIRKVPAEVTDALKAKYPDAQKVEWKDKVTYFEASFILNGAEMDADFSSKGEWQETQKKMAFDALPATVKDGFQKSKYNDWSPGSVTMIEKNDEATVYKIYVEKSSLVQKRFLFFNKEGQLEKETPGI
ncbi:hypothetical protein BH11BAC6_BH11BAC6_08790 [soil metagenome]